jgi:hypothetical protein
MKPVPSVRAVRMVTTDGRERAAMSAGVSARGGAGKAGGVTTGAAWAAHPESSSDAAMATSVRIERLV